MNPEQNNLQADDLRALALHLAAFTELLEQRGQHAVEQTHQAAQQLSTLAQGAAASSDRMTAAAIEQFRLGTAHAVAEGMRSPMEQAGRTMQSGTQNIQNATAELEQRVRSAGKALTANAWKSFVASAVASLAVIAVAIYMGVHTHQDMIRADWTGQINAAIANGKLTRCSDGGLCARAGGKWIQLDRQ